MTQELAALRENVDAGWTHDKIKKHYEQGLGGKFAHGPSVHSQEQMCEVRPQHCPCRANMCI